MCTYTAHDLLTYTVIMLKQRNTLKSNTQSGLMIIKNVTNSNVLIVLNVYNNMSYVLTIHFLKHAVHIFKVVMIKKPY